MNENEENIILRKSDEQNLSEKIQEIPAEMLNSNTNDILPSSIEIEDTYKNNI